MQAFKFQMLFSQTRICSYILIYWERHLVQSRAPCIGHIINACLLAKHVLMKYSVFDSHSIRFQLNLISSDSLTLFFPPYPPSHFRFRFFAPFPPKPPNTPTHSFTHIHPPHTYTRNERLLS